MLWNKTPKFRKTNWIDIGIALGTISGAFFGMVSGIMFFANLFLGLLICLIVTVSIGAMIGAVLDWLQRLKRKSSKRIIDTSRANTHLRAALLTD
ncbi:MAG: hypothetical protein ACFFAE_04050 [Candidatus Hodarchaeota archaeon]